MSKNTNQPEPGFVVCRCRHCDTGIEFDGSQAGQEVTCPQCGLETLLFVPQGGQTPPVIKTQPQPEAKPEPEVFTEPTWFGCEASFVEVRLTSGAVVKFKSVRLYDSAELNRLAQAKAEVAELLNGVSSPYRPYGDIAWVLFASKITGMLESHLSRESAKEGHSRIQKIAAREKELRANAYFFQVGQIDEIEFALPNLWTVLWANARFVHGEEDFITVKDAEDKVRKFRWNCVESYDYQANK